MLFRDCKFLIDEVGVDQRLLMPATTQLCEALSDSVCTFRHLAQAAAFSGWVTHVDILELEPIRFHGAGRLMPPAEHLSWRERGS